MAKECVHSIKIKNKLFFGESVVCTKCGQHFRLKRKYACLCFTVGLIGMVPLYFLEKYSKHTWLDIVYAAGLVLLYVCFNAFVTWVFYQRLKRLDSKKTVQYFDPQ